MRTYADGKSTCHWPLAQVASVGKSPPRPCSNQVLSGEHRVVMTRRTTEHDWTRTFTHSSSNSNSRTHSWACDMLRVGGLGEDTGPYQFGTNGCTITYNACVKCNAVACSNCGILALLVSAFVVRVEADGKHGDAGGCGKYQVAGCKCVQRFEKVVGTH